MKKFFVLLFGLIILILIGGCQNLGDLFPFLNRAPIITSEPVTIALEGNLYSYQVEVSDPDGDTLVYFFTLKPEGMNINDENGLITWTPTNDQVGMHQVVIEISDGKHSVQQNFEIEVVNVNNPPQILSYFPANLSFEINEGDTVKFEVQAHDIDLNTTLDYQWFLEGKLISSSSGIGDGSKSSWIYSSEYEDYNQKTVKVSVSDGESEDSIEWKITIKDITPPSRPTLNNITSPTNISLQILSGTKEINTSIWINGIEAIPIDTSTEWSYSFKLSEGENNISITSKDATGNESNEITATIILDTYAPAIPSLEPITSLTNISPQVLSGTKEANTAIWINRVEAVLMNSDTTWSYAFDLSEGSNNISITSRDAAGNESLTVTTTIVLDTNAPAIPTLNNVISPTNISPQILSGTKENNTSIWINGTEVIPLNSSTDWSYSLDLTEGTNSLAITSQDAIGNESLSITTNIILDTISPMVPTLSSIISPTNGSTQILSGTKEANTAIWINGVEAVLMNSDTTWSYAFDLSEGNNNISITSRDAAGNESSAITATIILDTNTPEAPTLNNVTSPTNISPQTLSGTKEANTSIWINGLEEIPLDSSTEWSYSFELSEGINSIIITSKDTVGNESLVVTVEIEYDLNTYVDAGNNSGIEDGTKTHPFNTISEGIEAVTAGKSVIVSTGTYNEQLVVNKGITLQGASLDNTFIIGSGLTGNLIALEADHINITGFTIDGASSTVIGIYFDSYSSININNNLIKNNKDYGISYSNSAPTIEENNIESNSYSGIEVSSGGGGMIKNNSIISNQYGIRTCSDSSPEISNNNISNNSNTGIHCREGATPVISYNTISNNANCGILIDSILGDSVNPDIGGGEGGSAGKNNITGNQTHGVSNKTSHNIMAKNNWWGDTTGPKYPGNPNNATISSDWAYWDNVNNEDGVIISDPYLTEPQTL